MEDDYNYEYENDEERYETVRSFFHSLDKENIVFPNGEVLFIVCEYIVCKRFGSREDNERLYLANLKDFAAFMYFAQPWFTPPEPNDVPLNIIRTDKDHPSGVSPYFSKEALDRANAVLDEAFPRNKLVMTDEYLYNNIDKVLQTPNLTYILINFSNIPVQEEILVRLAEIKTLVKLELSFLFSDITKIPDSIFSITTLKVLHISNIKTTELQSAIGNLKNLEILTVIQTQIETVPDSISELTELKMLELEINCITHLPSCIGELRELTSLCLLDNKLTSIPKSILELPKLQELNIMYNTSALVTDNTVALLKDTKPLLDLQSHEENSEEHLALIRWEEVYKYYKTLDTSKLIFENFEALQSACRELIKDSFGRSDEEIYADNVRSLKDLLTDIQPWH